MDTMTFNKEDIVLVPFPFNGRQVFKKRPAVIISKDDHYKQYGKYVCIAITSQEKTEGMERYEHKLHNTKSVGLIYDDQWVIPDKVFSIEDRIIIKKLGVMAQPDFDTVESMFHDVFD